MCWPAQVSPTPDTEAKVPANTMGPGRVPKLEPGTVTAKKVHKYWTGV